MSIFVASEPRVTYSAADGLGHLRLSRPDGLNAFDPDMVRGIASAVAQIDTADDLRAVLIDAEGPHFTVGADIKFLSERAGALVDELRATVGIYHGALDVLRALDIPVVCAVQGTAAGGGLGLLWCSDIVIGASDLKISAGFAALGLSPDGGATWALPRLVGELRARSMMMLGRPMEADEARECGLVDRVVAPELLHEEALVLAKQLAKGPTVAYASLKRLLRSGANAAWSEQLTAERIMLMSSSASFDAAEGVLSAAEKRPPNFTGH